MRNLAVAVLVFLLASPCRTEAEETSVLAGVVVGVTDGDTVDVRLDSGMVRIRMHAIDAPERGQAHGQAAKEALSGLVFGKAVQVEPFEQDRYDRLVARLWIGDQDVNAAMIKEGYAWVYRVYADDPAYCAYEKAARDLKRGLWASPRDQVVAPWEWRRRKTLDGQFTDYWSETVAACVSSLSSLSRQRGQEPARQ
jgi:endonuclease YncB( thermonuclease family)